MSGHNVPAKLALLELINNVDANTLRLQMLSYILKPNSDINHKQLLSFFTKIHNNKTAANVTEYMMKMKFLVYKNSELLYSIIHSIFDSQLFELTRDICILIAEYSVPFNDHIHIKKYGISVSNSDGFYDDFFETKQLTLELWIKPLKQMTNGNGIIIGIRTQRFPSALAPISLHLINTGGKSPWKAMDLWNPYSCHNIALSETMKKNVWYHIACVEQLLNTSNAGMEILYINGKLVYERNIAHITANMDRKHDISIGGYAHEFYAQRDFHEGIDCCVKHIRIWSVARTKEEIVHFGVDKYSVVGDEPGLKGCWIAGSNDANDLKSITKDGRSLILTPFADFESEELCL